MSDSLRGQVDYFEEEQREKYERSLRRSIRWDDPPAVVAAKCEFQDSVKYEFSPVQQDFIEPLLPSRRRRRR